jgi:hypothetical protein
MNTSWPAKPHDAQTAARIIFADHTCRGHGSAEFSDSTRCRPRSRRSASTPPSSIPGSSARSSSRSSRRTTPSRQSPTTMSAAGRSSSIGKPRMAGNRRPGQARTRAHHDCEPGAAAAPLYRRRRCHCHRGAEDRRSEGGDRCQSRALNVPRFRLRQSTRLRATSGTRRDPLSACRSAPKKTMCRSG